MEYCIARNFRGKIFLMICLLETFHEYIFEDESLTLTIDNQIHHMTNCTLRTAQWSHSRKESASKAVAAGKFNRIQLQTEFSRILFSSVDKFLSLKNI